METYETATATAESQSTLPAQTIAIIGGGLSGLMTAHLLEQRFAELNKPVAITIFEKSAGVGRLATRYKMPQTSADLHHINDKSATQCTMTSTVQKKWQFDFGAQFFTAKSKAFQDYIKQWQAQGIIERWQAQTAIVSTAPNPKSHTSPSGSKGVVAIQLADKWDNPQQPRYISSPKMTSWGREIAKALTHTSINYKTRVAPLDKASHQGSNTCLKDVYGNKLGCFEWVVCTAPQAQALDLLADSGFEPFAALSHPDMLACYTLMLGWASEEKLPARLRSADWDVLNIDSQDEKHLNVLDKIFIEHNKPSRHALLPSVTIHSNNAWAQAHVDDDIDDIKATMRQQAQSILGVDEHTYPDHIDCHRWRYAATANNDAAAKPIIYLDEAKQWLVTGDWCYEGRIESCYIAASNAVSVISK